jgi:hypothetical protein
MFLPTDINICNNNRYTVTKGDHMRNLAMYDERRSGTTATPEPDYSRARGLYGTVAGNSGPVEKIELASLLPGGQTHGTGSDTKGSGSTSGPEPVIGYGATKGIDAYYRTILRFAPQMDSY